MADLIVGQRKEKRTAFSRYGSHPYLAGMQLYYLFAMRQPDARTLVLRAVVQALEDDEYAIKVLLVDTNAIVLYGKTPVPG